LSHSLWERRFASDPAILGRALTLNDQPVTVVGVLPARFDFASVFAPGSHIDLFSPFPLSAATNRWGNTLAIIGRLKPAATPGRAAAELTVLAQQLTRAHPERNVVIILTTVAVTGGYLPARRASRLDPMAALRAS
jgi:hypothetical protein